MENMEEIYHFLEDFSKRKPKVIPQELNDYLAYVARTGDPVYQWSLVKSLFKEKLLNVITDFYESTPSIEIPPYPNVDPFNYEVMKNSLLERLDSFASAPFTVQRICELLTHPRKQYNRIDKFMRAIEKNILVVSTREPGPLRHIEQENGEQVEPIVNGSDNNSDYNVDVEMEDMSWKENSEPQPSTNAEPQPSSSDTHISIDDIEARLNAKQDAPMTVQEKKTTEYESVTPPEPNVNTEEQEMKPTKTETTNMVEMVMSSVETTQSNEKMEETAIPPTAEEPKVDVEMKPIESDIVEKDPLIIPEIKVEDAEMTEQRLAKESTCKTEQVKEETEITPVEPVKQEDKQVPEAAEIKVENVKEEIPEEPSIKEEIPKEPSEETPPLCITVDESSSDTNMKEEKEELETKTAEVLTSSEESSSSSDNTDGNSNSPKQELHSDSQESSSDANQQDSNPEVIADIKVEIPPEPLPIGDTAIEPKIEPVPQIQSENYSISDVKSELLQPVVESPKEPEQLKEEIKEEVKQEPEPEESQKTESIKTPTVEATSDV